MICDNKNISIADLLEKADDMQYKTKREHHQNKNSE
jgi:hypothetical protein